MQNSRRGILVLGSVNVDLVVRGARLPRPGETVLGGAFYQAAGGKGANQAVAAVRAGGVPVTLLAAIGDDAFGQAALVGFQQEQLDCRFLKQVSQQSTGVALIFVDAEGQNCISVASGANDLLSSADLLAIPEPVWQTAGLLLASLEIPSEAVACGVRQARERGLRTIVNPAPARLDILADGLPQCIDLLTPNESEAAALAGVPVSDVTTAVVAARRLQERGFESVIVTLGQRGSVVVTRGEEPWHCAAPVVRAVDTTAAGDAFNGALAVALVERQPLRAAVAWATRAATLSVTRTGAQPSLAYRPEIDQTGTSLRGT